MHGRTRQDVLCFVSDFGIMRQHVRKVFVVTREMFLVKYLTACGLGWGGGMETELQDATN